MSPPALRTAALAAALLLALAPVRADEPEPAGRHDAKALEILRRATALLESAQTLRFEANTVYDAVQPSGQKLQFTNRNQASVRRPDRMAGTLFREGVGMRRYWYDGARLTIYDEDHKAYGQIPVPDTLDAMLDYVELEIGAPIPIADVLYSDLSHLEERALESLYVGETRVLDFAVHHLAFRGESVDWQIWVEDGEQPLIRRFLVTYTDEPQQPQYGALFDAWELGVEVPDALFEFTPPPGAERIKILASSRRGPADEEVPR